MTILLILFILAAALVALGFAFPRVWIFLHVLAVMLVLKGARAWSVWRFKRTGRPFYLIIQARIDEILS